ncbi:E3 ubiquitin-protein ligase MPSR1-like [Bidens hawaiensis]|uniref:E3 ubiquitin-protein ligase MPSR1-like n=1 Tax=Bidens hawaiensis TaxID=980011 RepID=UPI0040496E96
MASQPHDSDHESTDRQPLDRIIVIDPWTQHMMVIGVTSTDFDSVVSELMKREGQPPATEAAIGSLPEVEVKKSEEVESLGGECVICLEECGVGDVAKVMPCQHKFHRGCLDKWLKIHGSCPVCRYKMPIVDDLVNKIGRRREIWVTVTVAVGNQELMSDDREEEEELRES